jgi:hypothetical protein
MGKNADLFLNSYKPPQPQGRTLPTAALFSDVSIKEVNFESY